MEILTTGRALRDQLAVWVGDARGSMDSDEEAAQIIAVAEEMVTILERGLERAP